MLSGERLWTDFRLIFLFSFKIHLILAPLINSNTIEDTDTSDQCKSAGCEHFCTERSTGVECSCKAGYDLASDGKTCVGWFVYIFLVYYNFAAPYIIHAFSRLFRPE
jgi:hypothetical protein